MSKSPHSDSEFFIDHGGTVYRVEVTYDISWKEGFKEVDDSTVKTVICEGDDGLINPRSVDGLEEKIISKASIIDLYKY